MKDLDYKINYWRTKSGLEVDFLINEKIAIEVKVSEHIHPTSLNGLKALNEELSISTSIIVCMETNTSVRNKNIAMFCM